MKFSQFKTSLNSHWSSLLLSFPYVWLCFDPGFNASMIANFIQYSDIPKFEARRRMWLETAIKLNWAFGVRTSVYTLRLPYHFRATKPCCLGMDFFHFESSRDRSFERRLSSIHNNIPHHTVIHSGLFASKNRQKIDFKNTAWDV